MIYTERLELKITKDQKKGIKQRVRDVRKKTRQVISKASVVRCAIDLYLGVIGITGGQNERDL